MNTIPLIPSRTLRRFKRLSRLLVIPAFAIAFAAPAAEAGFRDRDRDSRSHYRRHSDHHHDHRSRYSYRRPAPRYYAPPRVVRRTWSRPGFHGAYPPAGYVTYRYLPALPRYHRVVYRGGHRYYYANGAYYWPTTYRGRGVFIQINF